MSLIFTHDHVHYLFVRELDHGFSGDVRVRYAGSCEEQTNEVIDLGDRTYGRTGILGGRFLVNGDDGTQAGYLIYVRSLHLADEATGVGREGVHIPPLSLREDRVEGKRRLPRTAQSGDHRQSFTGNGDADILQVMHPRTDDFYVAVI